MLVDPERHEARIRFRDAVKQDSGCFAAYMELVRSYVREERHASALKELRRLVQTLPRYADVALKTFEDFMFDSGHFDDIEALYKQAMNTHPENIGAYLGLAEIYDKKGEIRKAAEFCRQALKFDKNNLKVKLFLIRTENKLQRFERSAELANSIADSFLNEPTQFQCRECSHRQTDYFLRCPECRTWNSAEKVT